MTNVEPNPLWALIMEARRNLVGPGEEPLSYRAIEARAARSGGKLTKADLGKFKNRERKHVIADKLIPLAAALELPVDQVVAAALETVGLPSSIGTSTPEAAIAADPSLSELDRRRLLRDLKTIREEIRRVTDPEVGMAAIETPMPEAGTSEEPDA